MVCSTPGSFLSVEHVPWALPQGGGGGGSQLGPHHPLAEWVVVFSVASGWRSYLGLRMAQPCQCLGLAEPFRYVKKGPWGHMTLNCLS